MGSNQSSERATRITEVADFDFRDCTGPNSSFDFQKESDVSWLQLSDAETLEKDAADRDVTWRKEEL